MPKLDLNRNSYAVHLSFITDYMYLQSIEQLYLHVTFIKSVFGYLLVSLFVIGIVNFNRMVYLFNDLLSAGELFGNQGIGNVHSFIWLKTQQIALLYDKVRWSVLIGRELCNIL